MSINNFKQAYSLANTYGFTPPRDIGPARLRITDAGKFEPDHDEEADFRTIVLAHWIDKTNCLIKYNPILDLYIPYHIEGTLTPDVTGNFTPESEYEDKPSYVNADRTYYIWYTGADEWVISDEVGQATTAYWINETPNIIGEYNPRFGAVGVASVFAGPE